VVCFTALSVATLWRMDEFEMTGKEAVVTHSSYYFDICLAEQKKIQLKVLVIMELKKVKLSL
jgi:hypothetical protein